MARKASEWLRNEFSWFLVQSYRGNDNMPLGGEYRLLKAMIVRAILDLRETAEKLDRLDAKRWLFSDSPRDFGFLWCCELLEFDSESIRARIKNEFEL